MACAPSFNLFIFWFILFLFFAAVLSLTDKTKQRTSRGARSETEIDGGGFSLSSIFFNHTVSGRRFQEGFNVQGEGWKTFACSSILKFRKKATWWRKYAFQKTPCKLLQTKIKKKIKNKK